MKKRHSLISALILLFILTIFVAGPGSSTGASKEVAVGEEVSMRVGHVLAPTHPYTLGLEKFAEIVNEKSSGNITVDVFHSSQLGNERDMIEGLQLGTQEMALVSTAPLSSFTRDFYVFDLPFIFTDTTSARNIVDGEIGTDLLNKLETKGLIGLGYFENGFRNVTNDDRPIEKPEDLQGLKIRTMESPIHMDSFTQMGASPTPMAFGELFTAMQQGTIDGQENPLAIIDTSKYYEVQDYLSITEHFYAPAPLLISKVFFEGLNSEYRTIIQEASIEARDYERQLLDEMNAELMVSLEKQGMKINIPDKEPFIQAVQPVYKKYEEEISKELIESIQNLQK